MQVIGNLIIFRYEGTGTYACGVCFAYTDNLINLGGSNARTSAATTRAGVGAGHEGIGAEIDIEHSALSTLEEDGLAFLDCLVHHRNCIRDVGTQDISGCHNSIEGNLRVCLGPAKTSQFIVGCLDAGFQYRLEAVGVGKVNHADTDAAGLISVGRADTLLRGTNLLVAESFFLSRVDFLVNGQHNVSAVGNEQLLGGDAHALIEKIVDFLHKRCGVNHYAITNDVHFIVPQDA